MEVRRVLPRPELRDVVRSFGEQRIDLGKVTATWKIPARPHQILDIYLTEPWKAQIDGGPLKTSPETVVVGPQSRHCVQLHLSGQIHVFNILFQPAAFHRLVGIDMASLVNRDPAAKDILGRARVAPTGCRAVCCWLPIAHSGRRTMHRQDVGRASAG